MKVIASNNKNIVGKDISKEQMARFEAAGWKRVYIRDRDVTLFSAHREDGNDWFEVSSRSLQESFDLLNGN